MNLNNAERIVITSPDFEDMGRIPMEHTGRDKDISAELTLSKISEKAKSIAVIMDDLSHPIKGYNHWVIWNIDPTLVIPREIPEGKSVPGLGDAKQGIGYGKHKYRGPKPPWFMKKPHHYIFKVFVLDIKLEIDMNSRKSDLLEAIADHVLQYGEITGLFGNDRW